ncbi:putative metal-dependent hydrolase [Paenibacillus sp. BSR1-1]|uniref:YfiT family bacillithiol transferase n=1 Tax=Paenibacillus sp. BSR1-1 TaxID=3020845 RepID=UPI0025B0CEEB|nr:bacillithiol transferase BstA [Paenibacillus sp. BSR1-1]MDN3017924.1 putative metal-dependent hydrolase [Paenibacillus sp. BSR1-1]
MEMDQRYPIGKFQYDGEITPDVVECWINEIEALPGLLQDAVNGLNDRQLDTPYRSEGWTVRQVVHHLADSHMNAYIRFKLALTEKTPVIKPYDEGKWAELPDSSLPVEISLSLLEALHSRWVHLLRNLRLDDLEMKFIHPESGEVTVGKNIGIYSWHGKHHLAHILAANAGNRS